MVLVVGMVLVEGLGISKQLRFYEETFGFRAMCEYVPCL